MGGEVFLLYNLTQTAPLGGVQMRLGGRLELFSYFVASEYVL